MKNEIIIPVAFENGNNVATLLEGKAPDPINPKPLTIQGTLTAARDYHKSRVSQLQDEATHTSQGINFSDDACRLEIDKEERCVNLLIDENTQREIIVIGSAKLSSVFEDLNINNPDKPYTSPKALRDALARHKTVFTDQTNYRAFLKNLENFRVSIAKVIDEKNDRKGNSSSSVVVQAESDITLEFDISTPVHVGMPKSQIKIEIETQERNGNIDYYLTSFELPNLIEAEVNEMFAELEEYFFSTDIPVIYQ
jgi:hypothetical protein